MKFNQKEHWIFYESPRLSIKTVQIQLVQTQHVERKTAKKSDILSQTKGKTNKKKESLRNCKIILSNNVKKKEL